MYRSDYDSSTAELLIVKHSVTEEERRRTNCCLPTRHETAGSLAPISAISQTLPSPRDTAESDREPETETETETESLFCVCWRQPNLP